MPGTTASTSQDRTGPGRVLAAWGGNQLWPRCVCVKPGGGGVGGGSGLPNTDTSCLLNETCRHRL